MDEAKKKLCQQLGIVDDSLGFLLLIIGATLLSYWAVVIQRRGLCLTIQGKTEEAGRLPDVYPLRHKASAIIVGALGFWRRPRPGTTAWPSARPGPTCGPPSSSWWRGSCASRTWSP